MLASLRVYDLCARWGGEEFLVLLPDTGLEDGLQVAERLRDTLAHSPAQIGKGLSLTVTLSLGLTTFLPGDTSDTLLRRADQALLAAKHSGRNCCLSA
jgi:diguanylate cyclase